MTSLKTVKIQLECSICTEAYKCDEEMTIIEPCNHHFHDVCLKTWFDTKLECPLCRFKILNDNDRCLILRMCVINRICVWFENQTLWLEAAEGIKQVLREFDIDTFGFNMTATIDFNNREAVLNEACSLRDYFVEKFELDKYVKILDYPLINHYSKKVYSYVPLTQLIRRHPKPVGLIGGLLNMGKAMLGMDY